MFQSGVVKLTSGDPTWWTWKALDYHYQTQPLPTWTSWYMHQMPGGFQAISIAFMYFAELIARSSSSGRGILRRIGFGSLVLLQLLIAATGNYGFFNLLTAILCLSVLDDRDWDEMKAMIRRIRPRRSGEVGAEPPALRRWSWTRRIAVGVLGGILVAVTAGQTLETVLPSVHFAGPVPDSRPVDRAVAEPIPMGCSG